MGLMEGAQSVHNQSYVRELRTKWGKMLGGVTNEHKANTLAVLYENQANYLSNLNEDTRAANAGPFLKFVFPVLRRVWPNLIANEIVSVQPMTAPIGGVFYFDLKYGTTKGKVTAGDTMVRDFNRYYSSPVVDEEILGAGDGATLTFASTLDFVPVVDASLVITATIGAADYTATETGGVISGTGPSGAIAGTLDPNTGAVSVTFAAGDAPDNLTNVVCTYEYNMEANSNIPQVNIDIQLVEVRATTRKLKALWSSEAADDLKAFHGIDAESEVVAGVAAEIALELDREIIQDLYQASALFPKTFDLATIPTATPELFHIRSLITVLTGASNAIHKDSLRGPANFMVTGPDVSALIEQLTTHGDFRPVFADASGEKIEQPNMFGVYKVGTLSSKYVCYKDPYFPVTNPNTGSGSGDILMGYKGNNFVDAGFVWAPYVPLQVTQTFLDPGDFTMRKGLRTRYAKKMLRPEFYRRVRVTSL